MINQQTEVKILSYNLDFHKAYKEVASLIEEHHPDIVCLQECRVSDLHPTIGNLKLFTRTTVSQRGLAIYCGPKRFELKKSCSSSLPISVYERLIPIERRLLSERLLIAELKDRVTKNKLIVSSLHAVHLVATNYLRRKQIAYALSMINKNESDLPAILIGDYNYPLFHGKLSRHTAKHGYQLVRSDSHTLKNRVVSARFDFAATANVQKAKLKTLPYGSSDHAPVLLVAEV
jgi:exodeoxyribonuclease III